MNYDEHNIVAKVIKIESLFQTVKTRGNICYASVTQYLLCVSTRLHSRTVRLIVFITSEMHAISDLCVSCHCPSLMDIIAEQNIPDQKRSEQC